LNEIATATFGYFYGTTNSVMVSKTYLTHHQKWLQQKLLLIKDS